MTMEERKAKGLPCGFLYPVRNPAGHGSDRIETVTIW